MSVDPDKKQTDLDLYCLQRQGISGFSRTRVKCKCLEQQGPGPSCSKLTTLLVNDLLKFTSGDTQIR